MPPGTDGDEADLTYPSRPRLEVLPQFRGDTKTRYEWFQLARLDRFLAKQYAARQQ